MQVIRGLHNIRPRHQGCYVSIGNFDGVHRGHEQILSHLVQRGRAVGAKTLVMIFEPQPKEFFEPDAAPLRITGFCEKLTRLAACGIDFVLVVPFNQTFRSLSAEDFVAEVLVRQLAVRHVSIGDDFRFGCDRKGSIDYLESVAQGFQFAVTDSGTIEHDATRISSTRIREALAAGNISEANALLGWEYQLCGRVVHGAAIGRTIGVPTANIRLHAYKPALQGVLAVTVAFSGSGSGSGTAEENRIHLAVANLGPKPTVNGSQASLEVHLLDFDGDLYGKHLCVTPVLKLRNIQKFETLDLLKQQIFDDIAQARAYFFNRER